MKAENFNGAVGIRPYRPEDVPLVYAGVRESIKELSPWMPWCHEEYSIADSAKFILERESEWEKGEQYDFMIYDTVDGTYLGGVGLNSVNRDNRFANLGYWVRTSRTRRGIAPAAVHLIARFGFADLKFVRLEILAAVGNIPSQRVAEKAGATREGILRNRLTLHGKQHDAVLFSLTPEDLRA